MGRQTADKLIMKTFFAFVLIAAFVVFPLFAEEDEGEFEYRTEIFNGSIGIAITGYHGKSRDIVIPALIKGFPVTVIDDGAFKDKGLLYVDIPSTVRKIGRESFTGNKLEEVVVPQNLTEIESNSFDNNLLVNVPELNSRLPKRRLAGQSAAQAKTGPQERPVGPIAGSGTQSALQAPTNGKKNGARSTGDFAAASRQSPVRTQQEPAAVRTQRAQTYDPYDDYNAYGNEEDYAYQETAVQQAAHAQQGGLPVQQSGYPAQPGGFPAQPSGYPAQAGGLPAQVGGFPAQAGGLPAQPSGYPAQAGGLPAQPSGYPAQPGGFPAQPSGYPAQLGGFPAQQSGLPAQVGGFPAQPGGLPAQQSGYPAQPSGFPAQPSGYPAQPGGYPAQQSGYPAQQSGYPAQAGGFPAQPSGLPAQAGGFPAQQSGYPAQAGGLPAQQSGYPAQAGGLPAQAGGLPAQPGGLPAQAGGFPAQQSGYPAQQSGLPAQQGGYPAPQPGYMEQRQAGPGKGWQDTTAQKSKQPVMSTVFARGPSAAPERTIAAPTPGPGLNAANTADLVGKAVVTQLTDGWILGFDRTGLAMIAGHTNGKKILVIPFSVDGKRIAAIGPGAFSMKAIQSVSFPSGISIIGERAFSSNAITEVQLPPSVRTISAAAFAGNPIRRIKISDGVTLSEDSFPASFAAFYYETGRRAGTYALTKNSWQCVTFDKLAYESM